MTRQAFAHLLAPGRIGGMAVKNRMVMSPMTTGYCHPDQTPSERLIGHFEERARGGVGLVTVELVTTDVEHRYLHRSMTLGDDRFIDPHRRLVDAVHQHGAKVQPQLSHTGPESVAPLFGGAQPLGPSVSVAPVWGWHSRPLAVAELAGLAAQYGEAARRAREAGYDGVELHAAHCYNLLGSFLSPLRNKRTDDYSGFKVDGRLRFLLEVLAQVKSRAGADFPVTLSISGYERMPGARGIEDTPAIAPRLVAGGVDCFRVSGGVSDALVSQMVNCSEHGSALNASHAEAIKQVVDVPVMVVGRIHDPLLAERLLAEGRADFIAMARPLLADPELPLKVAGGRQREIRRCISCENCIDSMQLQDNLGCAVNPFSGRERELRLRRGGKTVVVVGGGPGGLEAARLAAGAGHRVVLLERQRRLGGALLLAATLHRDNEPYLDYLLAEVGRLPVDVQLGTAATPQRVAAERPDAVIVATGARVRTPAIPGVEHPHVLTGALLRQLLAGAVEADEGWRLRPWQRRAVNRWVPAVQGLLTPARLRRVSRWWLPIGPEVCIIGADLAAVELAEFLASRGRRVHLLDEGARIAPEVGKKRRHEHMDRLDRLAVTVNAGIRIAAIEAAGVRIRVDGGLERLVAADTVIVAGHVLPDTRLADELERHGQRVYRVGDCTGLGLIAKATRTAAEAVCAI